MAIDEKPFLSLAGVRRLTGWSLSYLRKLRDAEVLKPVQHFPGGKLWYRRRQVEEMINGQEQSKVQSPKSKVGNGRT